MHREFRKLLDSAEGVSEFVIAIVLDIRGFSTFSTTVDSAEAALYVTKVYIRLIDQYFRDASFYKPTGDGLLVIIPYTEENLQRVASSVIRRSLEIVEKFPKFVAGERMIYFPVPTKVGIGMSRGTACRLRSRTKTLDYSGRLLNLASRLMNFARPGGVVMDSTLGDSLIPKDLEGEFDDDEVYIRGVAEVDPITVHYTKDFTVISNSVKKPLRELNWFVQKDTRILSHLKMFPQTLGIALKKPPLDSNQIAVQVNYPKESHGKRTKYDVNIKWTKFEYEQTGKSHAVLIDTSKLIKHLEEDGVKDNWEVSLEISYPVE